MLMLSVKRALCRVISRRSSLLLVLSGIISAIIVIVCILLSNNIRDLVMSVFLGEATVYAKGFSESKFRCIKVGMRAEDLQAVMGPPLKRSPWGPFPEVWLYTNQRTITDNFWRRWVVVDDKAHKVAMIIDDFWED
jgi:hypothetical protein